MSQKTFSRIASAVFTLVALGHVLRIAFGASVVWSCSTRLFKYWLERTFTSSLSRAEPNRTPC